MCGPTATLTINRRFSKPVKSVQALIAGGFDPLAYAVQAAHKRGLQLHAWLNPYRIGTG